MFKRLFPAVLAVLASLTAVWAIQITGTNSQSQNQYVKVGYLQMSVANAITAAAGGGQANAYQIADAYNRFTVVATAADSAKLPSCTTALVGLRIFVSNADAADAMNVFPATGEAINLLAANTAISVPAVRSIEFTCVSNGLWQTILSS